MRLILALLLLQLMISGLSAQTPAFDPKSWKDMHAGPPTQVLNLGSPHLSQLEKPVTVEMLSPLLDRLAAYKPDIITYEGLSGEQCDQVGRYQARYPKIYDNYCDSTADAEAATGFRVSAAMDEVEKALAEWPTKPTAKDRRHLAAMFLAAGDRPSAQVQWLQLPMSERRLGDGIDAALLAILARKSAKPNETFDVAAALAARLGLNRIYAVDDHTADSIQGPAGAGFDDAIQRIWQAASANTNVVEFRAQEEKMLREGDLLGFYRLINEPATQRLLIEVDFGAALQQQTTELYGRQYVAWYETRNLRMVANIRAAFGNKPGARVLNIVGASHKAYYDAYLDMMHEVKMVDAKTFLQ